MITPKLLEIIRCPMEPESIPRLMESVIEENIIISGMLVCPGREHGYLIIDGIPDLLPGDKLREKLGDEEFAKWSAALDTFAEWRKKTWSDPEVSPGARKRTDELKKSFFRFAGIEGKRLLDVGGAGGMVRKFLPREMEYVGIDPLPIPEDVKHFQFVRGVAEFLPFAPGAFDAVLIQESLDHLISPALFIDEAHRVLATGGRIYISQDVGKESGGRTFGQKVKNFFTYLFSGQISKISEKWNMEMSSRTKEKVEEGHTFQFEGVEILELVQKRFDIERTSHHESTIFIVGKRRD